MRLAVGLAALVLAEAAQARVAVTKPGLFEIVIEQTVAATPQEAWAALVDLPRWWDGAHSYSGAASNLTLDPGAGGCWCERWAGGRSVEHARVVMAQPGSTLRLVGGLGPLQALPATAVLSYTLTRSGDRTSIRMDYRVAGPGVEALAGPVDGVMTASLERLAQAIAKTSPPR